MAVQLDLAARVVLWDAVLAAVRDELRAAGLREVTTPPSVAAVAIEPWIEPVPTGSGWLHTSPELAMKSMLCAGAGPIFQITHVARAGERGAWHHEQFVMLEWYRTDDVVHPSVDVERIVARVFAEARPWARPGVVAPRTWVRHGFLDLVHDSCEGLSLRGDEDADALARATAGTPWSVPELRTTDAEARRLEAWTAFFTAWCDAVLDPWLLQRADAGQGVHVVEFPAPLAALAQHERDAKGRRASGRFESHACGRELANGYRELRDEVEQRARFVAVAQLRAAYGLPPLPMPEAFLAALAAPGLPPCTGAALGLERLIALAVGADSLDAVALVP